MKRPVATLLCIALGGLIAGCGETTSSGGPLQLAVIATPALTDTIGALPTQHLVVEVRDQSRKPYPGIEVHFDAPAPERFRYHLLVARSDAHQWMTSVLDTTDAQGRAEIAVELGTLAGTANLTIDLQDGSTPLTVSFTVLPGAPARMATDPSDTALYAGNGYQIRTSVWDRADNPIQVATYAAQGPVTVSASGIVSGQDIGRGQVVVSATPIADTLYVSVVPHGTIAVSVGISDIYGLAVLDLDGSGYRVVRTRTSTNPGAWGPTWSPDGTHIVYAGPYPDDNIYTDDLNGSEQRLVTDEVVGFRRDRWPEYTRDGAWVYFGVSQQPYSLQPSLWRAKGDGSAPVQVDSFATFFDYEPEPSPSPDGQHVIFGASGGLWNVDVNAQTAAQLSNTGYTPRWSPTGNLIAFIGPGFQSVRVANPDGSAERIFAPDQSFNLGLSWSPDGAWLIARSASSLVLIRVADGLVLPLAFTVAYLQEPAWRP